MTLIAAYKTLGGSFTGDLTVDPGHLREQRRNAREDATNPDPESSIAERRRRTRDAVEAALSDVILLGTEEQVLMATQVANDMVAGRSVETAALVASRHSSSGASDRSHTAGCTPNWLATSPSETAGYRSASSPGL